MKRLLLAASLALLAMSGAAIAKGHGKGHNGNGHGGHGDHHGGYDNHDSHPPGKHKGWHKGERIETVYLAPRYYVDYHHHHLAPPPRGHRWIRHPEGHFILVAITTGIIADILLHH